MSNSSSTNTKTIDDVSELVQHEYDHLNGVLCTMRAIDDKSFRWKEKS